MPYLSVEEMLACTAELKMPAKEGASAKRAVVEVRTFLHVVLHCARHLLLFVRHAGSTWPQCVSHLCWGEQGGWR